MDADTFDLFTGLCATVAAIGVLVLVGARLTASRPASRSLLTALHPARNALGALVAAAAMAGSLWYSEVIGYIPCEFCWYQRIAMYPLVAVLGVAAVRHTDVRPTATILAGAGLALSIYHVQLQRFPDQSSSCDPTAPCTAKWVDTFGVFTIPTMAMVAFAAILALQWLTLPSHPDDGDDRVEPAQPEHEATDDHLAAGRA